MFHLFLPKNADLFWEFPKFKFKFFPDNKFEFPIPKIKNWCIIPWKIEGGAADPYRNKENVNKYEHNREREKREGNQLKIYFEKDYAPDESSLRLYNLFHDQPSKQAYNVCIHTYVCIYMALLRLHMYIILTRARIHLLSYASHSKRTAQQPVQL